MTEGGNVVRGGSKAGKPAADPRLFRLVLRPRRSRNFSFSIPRTVAGPLFFNKKDYVAFTPAQSISTSTP